MCSSPKGSGQCFRQAKKKEFNRAEYEEHASMMRRASAVYDRIEQEKAESQLLLVNQKSIATIEDEQFLDNKGKTEVGVFSGIKTFFLQPIF